LSGLAVSGVTFLAIPIVLSYRVADEVLMIDTLIMSKSAYSSHLVIAALWAAALSSAISASLSAPRIIQALAKDRILPNWIGRGFSRSDPEPRLAMVLSIMIAGVGVLLGDLNAIGPILSMIYLTAFVVLNFSAGIESFIKAPSWRPSFRVYSIIPISGALFAGLVMLKRKMMAYWGDSRQGILNLIARYVVHQLQNVKTNIHSWRPNFLVLNGSPDKNIAMIQLVNQMNQDSGFVTIATIAATDTKIERTCPH
jgi:amino acid transporter